MAFTGARGVPSATRPLPSSHVGVAVEGAPPARRNRKGSRPIPGGIPVPCSGVDPGEKVYDLCCFDHGETAGLNHAFGIDLGGTHIKAVAATEDGEILATASRETLDDEGRWADAAREIVRELERCAGGLPEWIGLAAPGLAAPDGRSIASMPGRLRGLEGFDWAQALGAPVAVLNDAHAALLGEAWKGAAAGGRDVVLLTLGTGVGGAVLSGGRLLTGQVGRGGHLGHLCLDPDGPPDVTGMPGSLEGAIGN